MLAVKKYCMYCKVKICLIFVGSQQNCLKSYQETVRRFSIGFKNLFNFTSLSLKFLYHVHAIFMLSIGIASHYGCLAFTQISTKNFLASALLSTRTYLALALLINSIAQHKHCQTLALFIQFCNLISLFRQRRNKEHVQHCFTKNFSRVLYVNYKKVWF